MIADWLDECGQARGPVVASPVVESSTVPVDTRVGFTFELYFTFCIWRFVCTFTVLIYISFGLSFGGLFCCR
jgi:hypothetical protein